MLGSLRAQLGEREVPRFSTERTGGLLAYLAYHLGEPHPREVLAETIWPGRPPKAGRTSLNTALYSLRRQLEPPGVPRGTVIQSDRFAVRLKPAAVTTDVREFEAALRGASEADSVGGRARHLSDAVRLYQGELLPGFYDEWVVVEQRKLAEQYFEAAVALSALLERTGDVEGALAVAREAIGRDPLREEAHAELIRLLAASGEPAAALRHYAELKDLLARELGQEPSPATAQLARAIEAAAPKVAAPRTQPRPSKSPPGRKRPKLPTGTVTFLLTDIEGSTTLFERMGDAFQDVLETHHRLLRREFGRYGSEEMREAGDGFIVPFASASDAAQCAVACQRALVRHHWPQEVGALRVRMALYAGAVRPADGEYHDVVLHRASRVLGAAHGGQILCGEATAVLLRREPRDGVSLTDLGTYRLRGLAAPERLCQISYPDMGQADFPPVLAEAAHADNLPLQLTRFFGRERELHELQEILSDGEQRLVTLTGPGGSGKTRLALEAAREAMSGFEGGAWFVPLADLRNADLIPGAIVEALGLQRSPSRDPLDQVASHLVGRSALLTLDNLEQFGEAAGAVVLSLLDRCRSVTCLATSRRPLDLPGERLYPVPPLPTPEGGQPAEDLSKWASVRLFVDRAQGARPDFQISASNAEAIALLCDRLDGLPLALELAAARAQTVTPRQMVAQMQRPFDFLVGGRRVTEPRHKALEAAIDWSYQLLPGELQRFFASLSVFRGGCTADAAEAVCEEPRALEYLGELAASSLAIAEESYGVMRFRLLETLREFGRERLSAADLQRLRRRHAEWCLKLLRDYRQSPESSLAERVYRLESDHDNLRAALDWCTTDEGDATLGLDLTGALGYLWLARGYWTEARACLARVLDRLEGDGDDALAHLAYALGSASLYAYCQSDFATATHMATQALHTCLQLGDRVSAAWDMIILGRVACEQGDFKEARRRFEESLALWPDLEGGPSGGSTEPQPAQAGTQPGRTPARERVNGPHAAMCIGNLGVIDVAQGNYSEAEARWAVSHPLYREIGDREHMAHAALNQASLQRCRGEYGRARQLIDEAILLWRESGLAVRAGPGLAELGLLAIEQGDPRLARRHLEEALAAHRRTGARVDEARTLSLLGRAALEEGDSAGARDLHEQALSIARDIGARPQIAAAMDGLGAVAAHEGDSSEALRCRREALRMWHEMGARREIAGTLEAIPAVLAATDGAAVGAALLGAAKALRETIGAPVPPAQVGALRETEAAISKSLGRAKYTAARKRGRQMTVDEAVERALAAE